LIVFLTGHPEQIGIAAVSAGRFDAVFAVGRVESGATPIHHPLISDMFRVFVEQHMQIHLS
jgi:hypothetical protein